MIDLKELEELANNAQEGARNGWPLYPEALAKRMTPDTVRELIALASAAQDSIPSVKPWEQRMGDNAASGGRIGSPQQFMAAEIADWRAKGAAQDSAPAELPSLPSAIHATAKGNPLFKESQMHDYALSYAAALSRPEVAQSFWNSQRKMIERAIILLRDGCGTRKDADDALAALAAAPASPQPVAQEQKPFAYFVQPSSFGPYVECESKQVGAFPAYRAPQPVAKVLSDQEILDICDQIWHTDYQDDTRGYDLAIARAILAVSTPTTLTEKK